MLATIACASLLLSLPMVLHGAPTGGDSDFHIRWISHFTDQFWHGDGYPRWLNDDYRGYGNPVFYYYPPLGYIVAAFLPPPPLQLPADARLVAALILVRALAGFACYLWLTQLVSRRTALGGALLYVMAPYHLTVDLYVRTSYSELWSFVWLPLMLYCSERIRLDARPAILGLALSYAALIMSSLPAAVMVAFVPFVYLLLRHGWSVKPQLQVLLAVGLGIALSGVALVPALTLMDEVMSSALITAQRPLGQSFIGLRLLLEEPAKGGVTLVNLGLLGLVLASLWLVRAAFALDGVDRWLLAVSAVAVIAAFMVTPLSEPLWRLLGPLHYVQFPWRFNVLLELCLAALVPGVLLRLLLGPRRPWSRPLALLLGAGLLGWFAIDAFGLYRYAPDGPSGPARVAQARSQINDPRDLPLEWLPRDAAGAVATLVADSGPKEPIITAGRGDVGQVEESAAGARFHIRAESEVRVVFPRFFFPSVGVLRDGEVVENVAPSADLGLVTFVLPQGDHEIELVRRTLPEEWLGLAVSIAGLTALASMLIGRIGGAGAPRRARDLSGKDGLN